jgi:RNA polymerase nonessential primary-like sigma factor
MREAIVDTDELETGVLMIHDADGIDLGDDDPVSELEDDDDDKSPAVSSKADIDPDAKVNRKELDATRLYLREIEGSPLLTAEEEVFYSRKALKGDMDARKK